MPSERRRSLRVVLSLLVLLVGVFMALEVDRKASDSNVVDVSATLFSGPQLQLHYGRQQLSVTATSSSKAHETKLLELIADQFSSVNAETDFRPGLKVAREWDSVSAGLLYLVAATVSAEASIDANGVSIRGVSTDGELYSHRLELLRAELPEATVVRSDVVISDPEMTVAAMCKRNFASITKQPIQFRQSSSTIRQSSYPQLDRLGEFAYDCQETSISITGHTDATGTEAWNLQLSRARAQAVAEQLIARGVAAERLIIEGAGSSYPLALNDTVQGREQNRRIEIELR